MGIKDFAEKAAGAFAAEKALEAADPGAGFVAKAAAAVAGYEGVKQIKKHLDAAAEATPDDDAPAGGEPKAG
jgi:hypothetical protein